MNQELLNYYAASATELESVYEQPERQADLAAMKGRVAELLRGHKVLELACGKGYWTRVIAATAASVQATDINEDLLAEARRDAPANVLYVQADAFDLPASAGRYTAVFAGLWWSHVPRENQERYLAHLRAQLGKDVLLVLLDDCYVDGTSTVIARTDVEGNTFQLRPVGGERFEVLKNYPTDSYLRKKLANAVREIRIERLTHFWLLTARLK
ncbi:class I SAM-dependent methyltransferase [Pseudoduganella armeniaca]|uniref:Class I SAM-dependent methyltransferase n=1 Tax=Pseudoduganella armeniaca TaxID=2072590 RepID=A0A2R4C8X6_9BURK|nr:class I SAM-dependent methyltransferase [Pseudoduganella armeniaca]AVR96041.1 class I SAM-dependent methyltransferase [Pseudoduganella armeniaca]